jgi:hypothetical protein
MPLKSVKVPAIHPYAHAKPQGKKREGGTRIMSPPAQVQAHRALKHGLGSDRQ